MRQLANAISLFIRRMEDLDLRQDAMSIICFEEVCSQLDQETAYATYCELGKSQGIVESMESLADFLQSEAITLDRLGLSIQPPRANLNVLKQESKEGKVIGQQSETHYSTCILGCKLPHRFVGCSIYMQKSVQDRRQLINDNQWCYICLGMHMARNCNRKNEDGKCCQCEGQQHHRTLCSTVNMDKRTYPDPDAEGNQALQSSNNKDISGSVATGKSIQIVDYSPLVIVNVKSINRRCLDSGKLFP